LEETPLQRALASAPERSVERAVQPDEEFFIFRVGELNVGVRSKLVREVTRMGPLTPLPRAPSFLLGVVGHRGEVVPLIDLLRFFGQGESKVALRSRLFISAQGASVVGFVADQVIGLRRIGLADRLPAPAGMGATREFLEGVVPSREFGTLCLLDLERVVHSARQKAVAR
jgi:purine-binding chemotaxis protein CheW